METAPAENAQVESHISEDNPAITFPLSRSRADGVKWCMETWGQQWASAGVASMLFGTFVGGYYGLRKGKMAYVAHLKEHIMPSMNRRVVSEIEREAYRDSSQIILVNTVSQAGKFVAFTFLFSSSEVAARYFTWRWGQNIKFFKESIISNFNGNSSHYTAANNETPHSDQISTSEQQSAIQIDSSTNTAQSEISESRLPPTKNKIMYPTYISSGLGGLTVGGIFAFLQQGIAGLGKGALVGAAAASALGLMIEGAVVYQKYLRKAYDTEYTSYKQKLKEKLKLEAASEEFSVEQLERMEDRKRNAALLMQKTEQLKPGNEIEDKNEGLQIQK